MTKRNRIRLIVFDLAGTVVDHGSRAPAKAFCDLFARHGITATDAEARIPMGKHKRDHIADMLAMPSISAQWRAIHGKNWDAIDCDSLFNEFLPLQMEILPRYADAIAGTAETLDSLRGMGIRTAATTGYNNAMTELLLRELAAQGISFDYACCAADVKAGRPSPWMIFRCMEALDVYPAFSVVNVGDTIADIQAGVNAGVWSVGVTRTGNMTGLSRKQTEMLHDKERVFILGTAEKAMRDAGANAVIESVADLVPTLDILSRETSFGRPPVHHTHSSEPIINRLLEAAPRTIAAMSSR